MGAAVSIGRCPAMRRASLRVFVLAGDGSLLMNLGSLATIGWVRPQNLVVIVWDNAAYATTGGQDSATAHGADLEAAARAMGITSSTTVHDDRELAKAIDLAKAGPGRG
jgi:thiamine pyrophosphate-dependent acetolactate synthase large subunit-like protein